MTKQIRVGAVSYLNTKPLLYGIEHSDIAHDIDLIVDYPSRLAQLLGNGDIDIALLPVAAIPSIKGARIISDYGIAANGNVVSVGIFSCVPINEIKFIYLDYQSRTSVRLAKLLLKNFWNVDVTFLEADEQYISKIEGATAAVIIGDRALQRLNDYPYFYDLSAAWKEYTGLDFIFAAWVANKDLPTDFLDKFNKANAYGLAHLNDVVSENPFPVYDLYKYYTENICFMLDKQKLDGLREFLRLIAE